MTKIGHPGFATMPNTDLFVVAISHDVRPTLLC